MKTSRQRVLEYIHSRRAVRIADISHALKMTPANARHHLRILQEQGLVQVVGVEPAQGKGRPAQIFSASARSARHNLDSLSSALLTQLLRESSGEDQAAVLESIAGQLIHRMGMTSSATRSLTQAITQAVKELNDQNYQARWEAHPGSPRLILGHCPYAAIIEQHPELCQIDARLLASLLARPVEQVRKLAQDPQGGSYCLFAVK